MKCNEMNVRRAIKVMEDVPDDEFDMRDWFRRNECGTVACFAGHLALSPDIPEIVALRDEHTRVLARPAYNGKSIYGALAVAAFLGINGEDSRDICGLNTTHHISDNGMLIRAPFYDNKVITDITTKDVIEKLKQMLED